MFDKNERVIRKPKISPELQINITILFEQMRKIVENSAYAQCVCGSCRRPTNDPRKVNSRRWRRETRRRYPPPWRWMKADSHLPVNYTSFRLLPLSCYRSNDQVAFVRVEIRIETARTIATAYQNKNTPLTISTCSCVSPFCEKDFEFSGTFYLSDERITLGSGGNLRGERVTRFLKWPLIMQIERLPRSRVFRGLAFL